MSHAKAALVLVLLFCVALGARQIHKPNLADFYVYDAAAELVHEHQSAHLYDDANTGADFELKFVNPATVLGQAARHIGVDQVRLYIYPPILADLLLPLSFVSASVAGKLWLLINFAALLAIAVLMMRVLNLRPGSLGALALVVGLCAMYSTIFCLEWGQVTILLLLLWTLSISCYQRGRPAASALALGLATVVKLTPLLVVLPFLIWKDWKWLRAYALSIAALVLVICVINKPASLQDYFFHVMPSMSKGGTPDFENKSFLSSAELLFLTAKGASLRPVTVAIPKVIQTATKAGSLLIVLLAAATLVPKAASLRMYDRLITLAFFALLSACVAPISWKHAYVVAFLGLALLWAETLRSEVLHAKVSTGYLLLLTFCSMELGTFFFDSVIAKLTHGVLWALLSFLAPTTGIVLVFAGLARMGRAAKLDSPILEAR